MSTSLVNKERFNPSRLSNLAVWLDAADSTTIKTDPNNGSLIGWVDKSGNGNIFTKNFVGAISPVPEVTSSGPAIYFPPNCISIASLNPISLPYSKTIIAVYRCKDGYSSINIGVGINIPVGSFGICQINADPNAIVYTPYQNGIGDLTSSGSLLTTNYAFASFDASTNIVSGNSGFNNTTLQSFVFQNYIQSTPLTIGATNGQYTSSNFYIFELIVTSNAMTSSDRQEVEAYLAKKWNMILPTIHPYSNFQPSGEQWIPPELPSTISGLVSWFDMTISGQTKTNIIDRAGGNFGVVGSPNTLMLSNINKQPSLYFSGNTVANNNFTYLRKPSTSPGTSGTILFVYTPIGSSGARQAIVGWGSPNGTNAPYGPLLTITSNILKVGNGGSNIIFGAGDVAKDEPNLVSFAWNGSNFYLSTNGSEPSVIAGALPGTGTDFFIGRDGYLQAQMNMGELVFYQQYFEKSERQLLEGYLAWKWNIVRKLPVGHPFSIQSPTGATVYETSALTIPAQIPSLVTWLDAADTSMIVISPSGSVTKWRDKSSTSDVFIPTTSLPPTYINMNPYSGYLRPGVYFSGRQSLTGAINAAISSGVGSCFIVASIGTGSQVCMGGYASGTPTFGNSFGLVTVNGIIMAPFQGTNPQNANTLVDVINLTLYATGVIFARINATALTGLGDGSYNFTQPKNFVTPVLAGLEGLEQVMNGWQPSVPDASPWTLGYTPSYTNQQDFYLHEFLCFSEYFTDTQRQLVEGYIAWKWGIQGKLPEGHPYKTSRPQSA